MKLLYPVISILCTLLCLNTKANNIIYVTQSGAGLKNGTSWADAYDGTQFKPALDAAPAGNDFWVAAGTYYPSSTGDNTVSFVLKSGVGLYGGFVGNETDINQRDAKANATILSGDLDQSNSFTTADSRHVVATNYNAADNSAVLDGFTITGGNAPGDSGGGLYISNSAPLIKNCVFIRNYAGSGGAIVCTVFSQPVITRCLFKNNTAASSAPAIYESNLNLYNDGTHEPMFTVTVTNCLFVNNNYDVNSNNRSGIFIATGYGTKVIVSSCTFYKNAGSVFAPLYNLNAKMLVINSIIWDNDNNGRQSLFSPRDTSWVYNSNLQGGFSGVGSNSSGGGVIDTDPLFKDSTLQLESCSPAVNAGIDTAGVPVDDYLGRARPAGGFFDMGAYELQGYDMNTAIINITGPSVICRGQLATFTAAAGGAGLSPSYQWLINGVNTGTNSNVFSTDTISADAVIKCVVTSSLSCPGTPATAESNILALHIKQLPAIDTTGGNGICGTGTVTLAAAGNYDYYLWSTGATSSSITVSDTGNYSLTTSFDGCANTSNVNVVQRKTVISPTANKTTICAGDATTINAGFVSGAQNTTTKTYYIKDASGLINFPNANCGYSTNFLSFVNAGFQWLDDGAGLAQSVKVEFVLGFEYNANSVRKTTTFNGGYDGNGDFTGTDAQVCPVTGTRITLNLTPALYQTGKLNTLTFRAPYSDQWSVMAGQLGDAATIAKITVTYINYSGVYSWQPVGATGDSITVSPAATTTYTVTATDYGCTSTGDITITVKERPIITADGPVSNLCQTDSVKLTSSLAGPYLWSTGATTPSIMVHSTALYSVSADGCATASPALVGYRLLPTITADPAATFCDDANVNVKATLNDNGDTYKWSTGETTQVINVTANGNYAVTVTDATGCAQQVSQQVKVKMDAPQIVTDFTDISLYSYGYFYSPNYDYSGNITYTSPGNADSLVTDGSGIWITAFPGSYYIIAKDARGCTATSNTVTLTEAPGNPDKFGDNTWNVYAFNDGYAGSLDVPWQHYMEDINRYGFGYFNGYQGYYVDNSLSFDTRNKWDQYSDPSGVTGFMGNPNGSFGYHFSWSAKRKGFPAGNYRVSIGAHGGDAELYIDGVKVWAETGSASNTDAGHQVVLGPNSTIEFRARDNDDNTSACYGVINIEAAGITWTGATSTDWNDGSNWNTNAIPTATDNVNIPSAPVNQPTLTTAAPVHSIALDGKLTIDATGILSIGGDVISTGTFNAMAGGLVFNGADSQTVQGTIVVNNLTIANTSMGHTAGVTLYAGDYVKVYGTYTPLGGVLNANGRLVLASNANGTANVANSGGKKDYVTGKVTVERYIPNTIILPGSSTPTPRRAWRLLTAPLSHTGSIFNNWQNGGVKDDSTGAELFSPVGGGKNGNGLTHAGVASAIKFYLPLVDNWQDLTSTNGIDDGLSYDDSTAANNAFGVFITGPYGSNHITSGAQATTLRATGLLQTGDQGFGYGGVDSGKYLLIGNPYAAAIDFATIQKDNVANTVWLWDPQRAGTSLGGYVSYSWDEGTMSYDIDVLAADTKQTTVIQSGQAFFVQSIKNSSIVGVTIRESDKVGNDKNTNDVFFIPTGNTAQQLRIILNRNGESVDGILVKLGDNYSNTISDDAGKLFNYDENLSIKRDADNYLGIERMPLPKDNDSLWLDVWNIKAKTNYSFTIQPQNIPAKLKAYLLDRFLNTKTPVDLTVNSNIAYTTTTDKASYAEDRFVIVFANAGALASTGTDVKAWQQGNDIKVEWVTTSEQGLHGYVVERSADGLHFTALQGDITPRNSGKTETYTITDNLPMTINNYYRIQAIGNDGGMHYSNVVKVTITKTKAAISVYPNPVARTEKLHITMTNMLTGKYTIQLFGSDGKQVIQRSMLYDGSTTTQSIILPAAIAAGSYRLVLQDEKGNIFSQQVLIQ